MELLVATLILAVAMIGVYNLLESNRLSYQNVLWQNRVNQEARRALDDVCEYIRFGGFGADMLDTNESAAPQIAEDSSGTLLGVQPNGTSQPYYYLTRQQTSGSRNWFLTRDDPFRGTRSVAQFVTTIQFEYEYRQPSSVSRPTWRLTRVSVPAGDAFYLVKTVYVTVTSLVPSSVTGGSEYSRTLTGAVTLRAPYNTVTPPALRFPPPIVSPD